MLFVGRKGPVAEVGRWLKGERAGAKGLQVGCIHGPGGIGKTFLLNYCLQNTPDLDLTSILQVRIDGRKTLRSVEQLLLEEVPRCTSPLEIPIERVFPALLRCKEAVDWMKKRAEEQLRKEYAGSPGLQQRLSLLLSFGLRPQRALKLRPYDLELRRYSAEELEEGIELLQALPAFQQEWQMGGKRRLRNELRREPEVVLADALLADLSGLLLPKKRSPARYKRLLWIFDDYESVEGIVGDFVVEHMVSLLEAAGFCSMLLFVGRDSLLATHTAWGQHHRALLEDRLLELKPFGEQEAYELMRRRGIHQSEVCDRIWEETQGFPFLLDLECEDALSGGRSALGLKLFWDRLTRWMTPIQREWIVPLAFLDELHLESVQAMLPEHDAEAILEWFKGEPAIRDPHAAVWQVLPFVRRRIQQAIKNDSPQRFAALQARAQEVAKSLQKEV